ncbi:MAG: class I SAM-dependent methyltransferase [Caulobacteraceae bacterium]
MGSAADDIVGIYQRHAVAWTNARGTRLVEWPWLERFSRLLPPAAAVLDLGWGSGVPIGRYLVDQGFLVTGLDSAPEMISLFKRNLPDQAAIVGDMRALQLDRCFNGLLAWDSFFHLAHDHQRAMFPAFRQHARPHAALMFTSGPIFGEATGTLEGEPLYHASLDGAEYRQLLADNGFEVVAQVSEDATCGRHTVWLAQQR